MSNPLNLGAGGYRARVELPAELEESTRSTLSDLIVGPGDSSYQMTVAPLRPGQYTLSADGRVLHEGVSGDHVPDYLTRMLLLAELDATPELLHLHAGLVGRGGHGVLVAGLSGAGKTTLVTHLVRSGFGYGSDERVAVDPEDLSTSAFAKPVSIIPGSFDLFPELDPAITGAGQATELEWQVPASSIGGGEIIPSADVDLVIQVQYEHDATARIEPMHPATAAAVLLADSPDAARLGSRSLSVAAQLCGKAHCIRLLYSKLSDADRLVAEALETLGSPPQPEVTTIAPTLGIPLSHSPGPSDTVSRLLPIGAVLIDGRLLASTNDGTDIIELDEASAAWLMLLDGSQSIAELAKSVAEETDAEPASILPLALSMIANLAGAGLVA
ncbi:MAG: PqqD family peptide modification chaperone [Actinomycetia bacterium]|nr:PqqD family peptide modification chaperone [Actinomycetes bacterium]MCP4084279.1 PqqD family peptide modification chaperone [Actinomycetes bacterium]